jgi:hypothetical protein
MKLNYGKPTPSMSNTANNSEDKASYITSNFTDSKDTIEDEESNVGGTF